MTRISRKVRDLRGQCSHRSDNDCTCGAFVAVDRVELWNAIHEYVIACGGDPSKHVYGNARRMNAVVRVENAVMDRSEVTGELGRWVVDRGPP